MATHVPAMSRAGVSSSHAPPGASRGTAPVAAAARGGAGAGVAAGAAPAAHTKRWVELDSDSSSTESTYTSSSSTWTDEEEYHYRRYGGGGRGVYRGGGGGGARYPSGSHPRHAAKASRYERYQRERAARRRAFAKDSDEAECTFEPVITHKAQTLYSSDRWARKARRVMAPVSSVFPKRRGHTTSASQEGRAHARANGDGGGGHHGGGDACPYPYYGAGVARPMAAADDGVGMGAGIQDGSVRDAADDNDVDNAAPATAGGGGAAAAAVDGGDDDGQGAARTTANGDNNADASFVSSRGTQTGAGGGGHPPYHTHMHEGGGGGDGGNVHATHPQHASGGEAGVYYYAGPGVGSRTGRYPVCDDAPWEQRTYYDAMCEKVEKQRERKRAERRRMADPHWEDPEKKECTFTPQVNDTHRRLGGDVHDTLYRDAVSLQKKKTTAAKAAAPDPRSFRPNVNRSTRGNFEYDRPVSASAAAENLYRDAESRQRRLEKMRAARYAAEERETDATRSRSRSRSRPAQADAAGRYPWDAWHDAAKQKARATTAAERSEAARSPSRSRVGTRDYENARHTRGWFPPGSVENTTSRCFGRSDTHGTTASRRSRSAPKDRRSGAGTPRVNGSVTGTPGGGGALPPAANGVHDRLFTDAAKRGDQQKTAKARRVADMERAAACENTFKPKIHGVPEYVQQQREELCGRSASGSRRGGSSPPRSPAVASHQSTRHQPPRANAGAAAAARRRSRSAGPPPPPPAGFHGWLAQLRAPPPDAVDPRIVTAFRRSRTLTTTRGHLAPHPGGRYTVPLPAASPARPSRTPQPSTKFSSSNGVRRAFGRSRTLPQRMRPPAGSWLGGADAPPPYARAHAGTTQAATLDGVAAAAARDRRTSSPWAGPYGTVYHVTHERHAPDTAVPPARYVVRTRHHGRPRQRSLERRSATPPPQRGWGHADDASATEAPSTTGTRCYLSPVQAWGDAPADAGGGARVVTATHGAYCAHSKEQSPPLPLIPVDLLAAGAVGVSVGPAPVAAVPHQPPPAAVADVPYEVVRGPRLSPTPPRVGDAGTPGTLPPHPFEHVSPVRSEGGGSARGRSPSRSARVLRQASLGSVDAAAAATPLGSSRTHAPPQAAHHPHTPRGGHGELMSPAAATPPHNTAAAMVSHTHPQAPRSVVGGMGVSVSSAAALGAGGYAPGALSPTPALPGGGFASPDMTIRSHPGNDTIAYDSSPTAVVGGMAGVGIGGSAGVVSHTGRDRFTSPVRQPQLSPLPAPALVPALDAAAAVAAARYSPYAFEAAAAAAVHMEALEPGSSSERSHPNNVVVPEDGDDGAAAYGR